MAGPRREQLADGSAVWRVFGDWGHVGGYAILDADSGELIRIEETSLESRGEPPALPEPLNPSDDELFAFVQSKLAGIGWTQLAETTAERVPEPAAWTVGARMADGYVVVEVRGRRGNLSIVGARRGESAEPKL